MAEGQLILRETVEHGLGVQAGIEEGGFAGGFVPDEITIDGEVIAGGGEAAEFAPAGEVGGRGEPAGGEGFELAGSGR
jgi:hypothetical protein